jgi:hypothetical protein
MTRLKAILAVCGVSLLALSADAFAWPFKSERTRNFERAVASGVPHHEAVARSNAIQNYHNHGGGLGTGRWSRPAQETFMRTGDSVAASRVDREVKNGGR